MTDPLDIIVVGAGYGGLTAAIELKRKGANVRVFEATKQLKNQGSYTLHQWPRLPYEEQ